MTELRERHRSQAEADLIYALAPRFKRRHFELADVEKIIGDDEEADRLVSRLIARKALLAAIGEETIELSIAGRCWWVAIAQSDRAKAKLIT